MDMLHPTFIKDLQKTKDIDWHVFSFDNMNILLDVNSGAIHVIDKVARDVLEYCSSGKYSSGRTDDVVEALKALYSEEDIISAIDELASLHVQEVFLTKDTGKDVYESASPGVLKALCLNVAHECNLRCKYCFAGKGDFGGERGLMSKEVGMKAIDFLLENSQKHHCEVDFFGGEPLLNFDVVKHITEYGLRQAEKVGKKLHFTITTNGVLLDDDVIGFLNEYDIDAVLSLDGRKQVNDNMRIFADGSGTHDAILPNIQHFVASSPNIYYSVRGTYTSDNLDFAEDVLYLVNQGFYKVSVEPVVCDEGEPYGLYEEHLDTLFIEYEKLARAYVEYYPTEKRFSFFHFEIDLTGGPCVVRRLSGCGAGTEYMAVTPDGEIYPCHQFVGKDAYKLGDVFNGITSPEIADLFRKAYVYNKKECSSCWARFYCGGGCHANAYNMNGDIFTPYAVGCELMKKRIECAIWAKVNIL